MPSLVTIVDDMARTGVPDLVSKNNAAQFGRASRRYLGASILPERNVDKNAYREEAIRFRTVIAPDGTRYSAVQKRGGDLFASFLVELGHSDIGAEINGQEYDALVAYLNNNMSMEAAASMTRWLDTRVNMALIENCERQRWEALVDASVVRVGDNNYQETVTYANPAGHRAAQSAAWSTDSTDIFDNIQTMAQVLTDKGYTVGRMITSRRVVSIMAQNNTIKTRGGVAVVNSSGQITSASGRVTLETINQMMASDGLPPIETYDLQFRTQTGTKRFLKNDVFVMLATTPQSQDLDLGDAESLFNFGSVLGYHAIGTPVGQATPGRVIRMEAFSNKPPRIEAEGWMAHLPVIQEPEGIAVITGIT